MSAGRRFKSSLQCNLGMMYDNREGFPQNDLQVYAWISIAQRKASKFKGGLSCCKGKLGSSLVRRVESGMR